MPALTRCSCTNLSRAVTRAWTTAPPPTRLRACGSWVSAAPPVSRCNTCWVSGILWTLRSRWAAACSAPAPTARSSAAAIELLKDAEAPVVYDLCAGTGGLGLGIARHLPGAAVTCVEKSADAWPYLTANVAGTGVQAVQGDILTYYNGLPSGGADLIISNPPYLTAEEMAHLMPETAREPAMALDGGADGLDFYRLLTAHYRDALRPGGWLVLEIGCAQAADVLALGRPTAGSTAAAVKTTAAMTGLFCCKNLKKAAENPIYRTQNTQQNVVICS